MNSMKKVGVTTTNNIEGWEIQHYFQPVTSHLVVGTNVFSDFLASFTDFFGGASKTYQRKIAELYTEAIEQLRISGERVGANHIIGLSIDLDEISGKGKSMFMITAIGTPVIANRIANYSTNSRDTHQEPVTAEKMNQIRQKEKILTGITNKTISLEKDNWQFVLENKLQEAFPYLMNNWRDELKYSSGPTVNQEKISQLLSNLEPKIAAGLVYEALAKEDNSHVIKALTQIIKDMHLVDLDLIEQALNGDDFEKQKKALYPVIYDKEYYSEYDIRRLEALKTTIQTIFKERGERSSKKQMFSSKEKEIWKCECGKTAEIGANCFGCGKDLYGFKSHEVKPDEAINYLDEKLRIINDIVGVRAH